MRNSSSWTRQIRPLGLLTATALTLVIAACNSGGSGVATTDPDPGGSTEPARVATLEYFTGDYTGEGGLFAVPPSAPTAFENVDPQADTSSRAYQTFGIIPIVAAQSATAASVSGLHVESVLYPRRDGTLWRVTTDPDAFPPVPVRVSSADRLEQICMRGVARPPVYANPDATPFVYALPAPGMGCDLTSSGSVTWHVVLAGDDAATAPRNFPAPDTLVGDFDYGEEYKTGTIVNLLDAERNNAGWLIRQDGQLTRVAPDGTVAVTDIFPVAEMFGPVAPQLASGVLLLTVDGKVMAFDPADNSLTALEDRAGNALQYEIGLDPAASTDGKVVYLVQQDTLYRTTDGGRAVVKIDKLDSGYAAFQAPYVGDNRVAWMANVPGVGQALRSVEKSATEVGSGEVIATYGFDALSRIVGNSGEWLFYGVRDYSGGTTTISAVAQRMDGSAMETFANAKWVGATLASNRVLGEGGNISRVYRIDGLMGPRDSMAGKSLLSVLASDPVNTATTVNVGTLAGQFTVFPGFGPGRLAVTQPETGDPELAWFDDSKAGSLQSFPVDNPNSFPLPLF